MYNVHISTCIYMYNYVYTRAYLFGTGEVLCFGPKTSPSLTASLLLGLKCSTIPTYVEEMFERNWSGLAY